MTLAPPQDASVRMVMRLRSFVRNTDLLKALERTPRALFGLSEYTQDSPPSPSHPEILAPMIEALQLGKDLRVLEIGTGSGYQSALIAPLVRRLYTLEPHTESRRAAQDRFKTLGLTNITTLPGKSLQGWPKQAPFDRILLMGTTREPPLSLLAQLKPEGIMVAPIQKNAHQSLLRLSQNHRHGHSQQTIHTTLPLQFPPLV